MSIDHNEANIDQAWVEIHDTMADTLLNHAQKKVFVKSILSGVLANPPVAHAPEIREAMTWTKDLPTSPGWYWMRKPGSKFAKVQKISMYDSELVLDEAEAVYDLRYYPNYDWYGPIPQPQDPKAEGGKV